MAGMAADKDNHSHILEQEATQLKALQQNHLKMAVQKIQVSHSQNQVSHSQNQGAQTQTQGAQTQTQVFQIQKVFSSHLEQTVRQNNS